MSDAPGISLPNGLRIAVTGASGFIGARIVDRLVRGHGAAVTVVVRDRSAAARLASRGLTVRRADLGNRAAIGEAVRGHDVVVNAAHDFRASERRNLRGFSNLLDACRGARVPRFVHISSIVVYGDWPHGDLHEGSPRPPGGSAYVSAKVEMEALGRQRAESGDLTVTFLQPTIVYGPHGWMWTDRILEQLRTGTVVLPNRCDGHCHAVYVDDVARAAALACGAKLEPAESFIVSGAEPVTWRRFFEAYDTLLESNALRFADLDAPGGGSAPEPAGIGRLVRDPMLVAQTAPARAVLGLARRAVGNAALGRIRSAALALERRRGTAVHHPSRDEIELYAARGTCSIGRARRRLGYEPAFDLDRGMAEIAKALG